MASELRVNTSSNRVGLGTITYTDTGPIISGITTGNNFKTGTTNVHSTGVELTNINTGGATATFGGYISLPQKIIHTGDPDTSIEFDNNIILFETAGSPRLKILSGGVVLIGNTTSQEVYGTNAVQVQGTSGATSSLSLLRHGNSPYLVLGSSGGSSLGAVTALSSGNRIGQITFAGADGTDINTHSASIAAYVDGSVSSNAVPGRLVFATSTGASELERMRIESGGNVNFGAVKAVALPSGSGIQVYNSSTPRIKLVNDTTGNAAGDGLQMYISGSSVIFDQKEDAEMRFYTDATEKVRITSGVVASFGNSSPPAWADDTGYYNIQLGKTGYLRADTDTSNTFMTIGHNAYKDSGGWKYAVTSGSSSIFQQGGAIVFETAASGTAGNALTLQPRARITSGGDLVVGGTAVGNAGSLGIQQSGHLRTVLANGGGAGDTLFGAISGVSNGFQINVDSSNNQEYRFHNGSSRTVSIKSSGVTEFGSNGNYGANPRTVSIGSRTQNIFAPLAIARGEAIGGGTGPYMEFVHGPDGGTQRIHSIYSYVGDLRIVTDSAENLELHTGGACKAKLTNTGRFQLFDGTANYIESADFRLTNTENPSDHQGDDLILTARYNTNTTLISAANTGTGGGTRITFTKACYVLVCMSQDADGNTDAGYWSVTLRRDNSIIGYHLMRKTTHWDMFTFQQATYVGANSYLTINWNGTSGWTNADANSWSHYTIMAWENR